MLLETKTVMMSCFNKYYYTMKSQYNNISMLKLKHLSKANQSECNAKCNHSVIDHCGKFSHDRNEEKYFSKSQNRKGGRTIDE